MFVAACRTVCARRVPSVSKSALRHVSSTSARKLGATRPASKKHTPLVDGSFFGEEGVPEEVAEKPTPAHKPAPSTGKMLFKDEVIGVNGAEGSESQPSSSASQESPLASLLTTPPPPLPFDAQTYYDSWAIENVEPALSRRGYTLFDYIAALVDTQPARNCVANLNPREQLDLQKRLMSYEIDQENPTSHLPVLEFYLRRGVRMLPPVAGELKTVVDVVDREEVRRALGGVKPVWTGSSEALEHSKSQQNYYPDLMQPDAVLDPRDEYEFPPTAQNPYTNRVIVRNHRSVFHDYQGESNILMQDDLDDRAVYDQEGREIPGSAPTIDPINEEDEEEEIENRRSLSSSYFPNQQECVLMKRRVVHQTGKGKIRSVFFMVLIGNGDGLVGVGTGTHEMTPNAMQAARLNAIKNLDWVERFEKRTIWTEMRAKFGATELILRPRPVGFGLRCNPHLHRILRAAGLKDISAKVWGSRNKLNVINGVVRMLHAGHAPHLMGDGVGGKAKKMQRGCGLKSKGDVERARGRKLIGLRQ